jgi:hypothetical protein
MREKLIVQPKTGSNILYGRYSASIAEMRALQERLGVSRDREIESAVITPPTCKKDINRMGLELM